MVTISVVGLSSWMMNGTKSGPSARGGLCWVLFCLQARLDRPMPYDSSILSRMMGMSGRMIQDLRRAISILLADGFLELEGEL